MTPSIGTSPYCYATTAAMWQNVAHGLRVLADAEAPVTTHLMSL